MKMLNPIAFLLLFGAASLAHAGATDDAQTHLKAIGSGNVDGIMQAYGNNPNFQWVGGPLNGDYVGAEKIKEVWTKFTKANAPLEVNATKVEESTNPAGSTVTANVEFKGKNTIKVRYVMLFRDGKLVNEIWQIDPKLALSY